MLYAILGLGGPVLPEPGLDDASVLPAASVDASSGFSPCGFSVFDACLSPYFFREDCVFVFCAIVFVLWGGIGGRVLSLIFLVNAGLDVLVFALSDHIIWGSGVYCRR